MALTASELADVRTEIGDGDPPSTADLNAIHLRRVSVRDTILEVLQKRLATYIAEPANFTITGDYSQNVAENIKALERQIARVRSGVYGVAVGGRLTQLQRAEASR